MLDYYISRLAKSCDNIDAELVRWIRIVTSPNPIATDEERVKEVIDLVTAYQIVKGGGHKTTQTGL